MTDRRLVQIRLAPRKVQYTQEEQLFQRSIDKVCLLNQIAKFHNQLGSWLESIDSQYRKEELSLGEYDERWRELYSKRAALHEKYCQILRDHYPEITLETLKEKSNTGGFLVRLDTMA